MLKIVTKLNSLIKQEKGVVKRTEINDFIRENNLLETCKESAGIYAITIDNYVAYIGQSKNIFQRCSQHIYNIENAGFNHEKKYELLLAAKLGGSKVDCHFLEYCGETELTEREDYWIEFIMPPLNILTPLGKQDISKMRITELFYKCKWLIEENELIDADSLLNTDLARIE